MRFAMWRTTIRNGIPTGRICPNRIFAGGQRRFMVAGINVQAPDIHQVAELIAIVPLSGIGSVR